jgi:hypothetical protein
VSLLTLFCRKQSLIRKKVEIKAEKAEQKGKKAKKKVRKVKKVKKNME